MVRTARVAGVFYLLTIVAGIAGVFVRSVWYGDAANLIATACYVVVTVLLYMLFKPVSRSLSLLAAAFSLAGCALAVLGTFRAGPSRVNDLVFFGFYCLLIGFLIYRSGFAPRFLGVLMALAGVGWLTYLSPQLSQRLSLYTMASGLLGEGALTIWLLAGGRKLGRTEEANRVQA